MVDLTLLFQLSFHIFQRLEVNWLQFKFLAYMKHFTRVQKTYFSNKMIDRLCLIVKSYAHFKHNLSVSRYYISIAFEQSNFVYLFEILGAIWVTLEGIFDSDFKVADTYSVLQKPPSNIAIYFKSQMFLNGARYFMKSEKPLCLK